jgi:hypothetical protein
LRFWPFSVARKASPGCKTKPPDRPCDRGIACRGTCFAFKKKRQFRGIQNAPVADEGLSA